MKREDLLAETRQVFNEIVIATTELVRIIGYGEDDSDCYFLAQSIGFTKKPIYHSYVGGFTRLKGALADSEYQRIDQIFTLNGCPPMESFVAICLPYVETFYSQDEY